MKKAFLLILLVSVFFSCKKDNKTCNQDMAGIAGTYKVVAITYKLNSAAPEQDFFSTLDACKKDDLTVLNASGGLTYTDAGTKCAPAGDYASTWSVSGSTITINGDPYTIQSFNCSTMVVTASGQITAGDLTKVTLARQ
jgi:hypothetical protein